MLSERPNEANENLISIYVPLHAALMHLQQSVVDHRSFNTHMQTILPLLNRYTHEAEALGLNVEVLNYTIEKIVNWCCASSDGKLPTNINIQIHLINPILNFHLHHEEAFKMINLATQLSTEELRLVRQHDRSVNQTNDQAQPSSPAFIMVCHLYTGDTKSEVNKVLDGIMQMHLFLFIAEDIMQHILSYLDILDKARLTQTCKRYHAYSLFQTPLIEAALESLLQAVVDDDRSKVKRILDSRSQLVLHDPKERSLIIESKYTRQMFYAENPLIMATKGKRLEMVKILLPYCDQLKQTPEMMNAKENALAAWVYYTMDAQGDIVIPKEYASYLKSLIDVLSREKFTGDQLSRESEESLRLLLSILVPERAVSLDDYLDVELFLIAAYKAYVDHFYVFQNKKQRDEFGNRVIRLIQNALSPEMAKIWCEGLGYVVEKGKKISERAAALKLEDGETDFYLPWGARLTAHGVGVAVPSCWAATGGALGVTLDLFQNHVRQKQEIFDDIKQPLPDQIKQPLPDQQPSSDRQSECVIS